MVDPKSLRASGETQVDEVVKIESEKNELAEAPEERVEDHTESPRSKFRSPGFHRMKLAWTGEEGAVVSRATKAVDDQIRSSFSDAFRIMFDLYLIVRIPEVDENGEIIYDSSKLPVWKRGPAGDYIEDWSALNRRQREDFLFRITTRLFAWEQIKDDAWGQAMFAKASWEERFASSYIAPRTGTVDDRTNYARTEAQEERYFGIFLTLYSRKADSIVRTMGLLGQRLKDTFELG